MFALELEFVKQLRHVIGNANIDYIIVLAQQQQNELEISLGQGSIENGMALCSTMGLYEKPPCSATLQPPKMWHDEPENHSPSPHTSLA